MAISVASIIARATIQLLDAGNVRWTQDELVSWVTDAQREIAALKPNASVVNTSITLVAGVKQTLPDTSVALKDLIRNTGLSGSEDGAPVNRVSRGLLDDHYPGWAQATASPTVVHYMYDIQDPLVFYVYPPQPSGNGLQGQVEAEIYTSPNAVSYGGNIFVDDGYAPAILDYVLYRAWAKDAEFAGNVAAAKQYLEAFVAKVAGRAAAEKAM